MVIHMRGGKVTLVIQRQGLEKVDSNCVHNPDLCICYTEGLTYTQFCNIYHTSASTDSVVYQHQGVTNSY